MNNNQTLEILINLKRERVRGNSAAFPPQHAVERSSPAECFTSAAAERPLDGGRAPGFSCQRYPRFCWAISVGSLPPSWQSEQKRRTSEKWIILLSFWEMVNPFSGKVRRWKMQEVFFPRSPLLRCPGRSLVPLISRSREGRTQFCFLQPLLYCILYRTFSFFCSSLNQSFNTLEDLTFFGDRHVNHPNSFGKSFGWILILAFDGLHILLLLSLIDTRYFVTLVHTFLINTSGFVISNTHLQSHTDLLLGSAVTPVLRGGLFPFPPLIHWFSP